MSIKFFGEITEKDIVGGKGKSLAKMFQNGFEVPDGFVIGAEIFEQYLEENNLKETIKKIVSNCNLENDKQIEKASKEIINLIDSNEISDEIKKEIKDKFRALKAEYVAVRSSATSEDGMNSAWAGQLETYLNIDKENIIYNIKNCWKSLFSPRAIFYRLKRNDESYISIAVVVQKMIQSDISGVAFSANPVTNNRDEIVIEAILGLGEALVSGSVNPDIYVIDKEKNTLINKEIKNQSKKMCKTSIKNTWVDISEHYEQKLSDELILELSNIIRNIEKFYGFPVDVEWGIENNKIYILQCRPITTIKKDNIQKNMQMIKNTGEWVYYVSRKFIWYLESSQIAATSAKNQDELLNFNVATKNYLILNGDEYSLDEDSENINQIFQKQFKEDIEFFEKFAKIEFKLVDDIKLYIDKLKKLDFKNMSLKELADNLSEFNKLYVKSCIPGFTRPESFLEIAFKKELENMGLTEKEKEEIFKKISTCPNYFPLSYSEEPVDLLKIALILNEGKNIDSMLEEHIEKYAWIKAPVAFENTCFTKEDYIERLNFIKDEKIEEKLKNIENVRKQNDENYENILKKYNFSNKTLKLAKAIRDFIFLRTYTTEYTDHLFYTGRHSILKEISQRCNIKLEDLVMLEYNEILEILNNNAIVTKETKNKIESRRNGFAIIWLNGNVETFLGKEALELQSEIGKIYKTNENNEETEQNIIKGMPANRGKIIGTVKILLNYEDIKKVKKGDIIVASMTTPDYVSAMEKAAGFITDEGGITCHAAIVSREFDVPCIVGTINATQKLKDGQKIELDAYNGEIKIL